MVVLRIKTYLLNNTRAFLEIIVTIIEVVSFQTLLSVVYYLFDHNLFDWNSGISLFVAYIVQM